MHEMATLGEQIDELDLHELESLEEQATDRRPTRRTSAGRGAVPRAACVTPTTRWPPRSATSTASSPRWPPRRSTLRGQLSEALLATYDRKRAALGVAVARLVGKQCQGCHLELSAAEIDTVKDEAADTGVTDCPDCGRLLIV